MDRVDVLSAVYGFKKWVDLKEVFVKEARGANTLLKQSIFLSRWNYFFVFETPISTLKSRSIEMRKALIDAGIEDGSPLVEFFKIPTSIFAELNKKADESVSEELMKPDNNQFDYVNFAQKTMSDLMASIEANDVLEMSNNSRTERELAYQKLIVLALATGRRQIELLKTLSINKKKDEAIFSGLAKKKESDSDSITAPILIDATIAKKYLKDIREEFKTEAMTNKEINSKYNASISKSLFRYLSNNLAEQNFHFLRSVYAKVCFEKFGNGADENQYIGKILGHELVLNSAHNYQANIKRATI